MVYSSPRNILQLRNDYCFAIVAHSPLPSISMPISLKISMATVPFQVLLLLLLNHRIDPGKASIALNQTTRHPLPPQRTSPPNIVLRQPASIHPENFRHVYHDGRDSNLVGNPQEGLGAPGKPRQYIIVDECSGHDVRFGDKDNHGHETQREHHPMEEDLWGLVARDGVWGEVESGAAFAVHGDESRAGVGIGRYGRLEGQRVRFAGLGGDGE